MKHFILLTLLIYGKGLLAQTITPTVINSTGGTATVGNLIVDWNVGEAIVSTQTNGIIVTNGQLQPVDEIISSVVGKRQLSFFSEENCITRIQDGSSHQNILR